MQSDQINELANALALAQAKMPSAKFNSTNPYYHSKYADLGAVIEASRQALADNGLACAQLTIGGQGSIGVETILMHKSGQWISSVVSLPIGDDNKGDDKKEKTAAKLAQEAGSIISYLRRYSLASMLGIYADEDTDGNQGQKPAAKVEQPAPAKKPAPANPLAPAALEFLYRDGEKVDMGKPREIESFKNYLAAHNNTPPASREALRAAVLAAGTQAN